MAKVRRIDEIAKDLGVDCQAIIDKCKAEGVPGVESRWSVVRIGLELTIRDWFKFKYPDSDTDGELVIR